MTCLPQDLPEFMELEFRAVSQREQFLARCRYRRGCSGRSGVGRRAGGAIDSPRAEEPEPIAAAAATAPAEGPHRRAGSGWGRAGRRCGEEGRAGEGGRQERTGEERRRKKTSVNLAEKGPSSGGSPLSFSSRAGRRIDDGWITVAHYRRSRQSGTRTPGDASQRRLLVRRRARSTARRGVSRLS